MDRRQGRRLAAVIAVLAAAGAAALAIRAYSPRAELYAKTVRAMGTFVTVNAWSSDGRLAASAIDAALAEVDRLEALMSSFQPASDVSRINTAPPGAPVKVSRETAEVLATAQKISAETEGAFDVTVGPLVTLWREARKTGVLPSPEAVAAAKKRVSYKAVRVNVEDLTVTVLQPGVDVDLAAIAKGYVAGKAAEALEARGIRSGFVDAGGDIVFIDANSDGSPWRVGVADPRDPSQIAAKRYVRDKAVVTSGNYEQYADIGGARYSHIIEPRTGRALSSASTPASVTVVADDGGVADAWATGLSVLGRDGLQAAEAAGVEFLMLFVEDGRLTRFETPGLARYLEPEPKEAETEAAR